MDEQVKVMKFALVLLSFVLGAFFQASDIALSRTFESPKIIVKKKSLFWKVPGGTFAYGMHSALNTTTGETLVVWQENASGTRGRILTPAGKLSPKKFSNLLGTSFASGVAYNPVTQEFLVVVEYKRSIAGLRLNPNAKLIAPEFEIIPTDPGIENFYPHVIFNPQTNGYTLIWQKTDGIAAALLDESGKRTGPIIIIKKSLGSNGFYDDMLGFDGRIFDVDLLSQGNKLLIIFQQRFSAEPPGDPRYALGGQADDWLATLDPMLRGFKTSNVVKINKGGIVLNSWGNWLASAATLQDGSAVCFFADDKSVKMRRINQQGKLSGAITPAFSAPADKAPLHNPVVAFSTTSDGTVGLLIAHEWSYGGFTPTSDWARALDAKGFPVGDPIAVDRHSGYQPMSSLLIALPRKPSDEISQFVWLQSGGQNRAIVKYDLELQP